MPPTRQFDGVTDVAPVSADPFGPPTPGAQYGSPGYQRAYPPTTQGYPPPGPAYPPQSGAAPSHPPAPGAYGPPPGYDPQTPPPGYGPQPPAPGYAAQARPPGYGPPVPPPPGYGAPGYGPPVPRRRNGPLIALVLVIGLLLCGGTALAGVLAIRAAVHKAGEAVAPYTDPNNLPDLPGLPTELPTGLPENGNGTPITVGYEITGDGPADITYVERNGGPPKQLSQATLPWRVEVSLTTPALVSVTALRSGTTDGSLACRATVNGAEVSERESRGTFAVVSCTKFQLE